MDINLNNYNNNNYNNNNNQLEININLESNFVLIEQEDLIESNGIILFKKEFPNELRNVMEEFEFTSTIESINTTINRNLTKRNYLFIGSFLIGILFLIAAGVKSASHPSGYSISSNPKIITLIALGLVFFILGIFGCATNISKQSKNKLKNLEKILEKISNHFNDRNIKFTLKNKFIQEYIDENQESIDKNHYISNEAYRNTIFFNNNGQSIRSQNLYYLEISFPKINNNNN